MGCKQSIPCCHEEHLEEIKKELQSDKDFFHVVRFESRAIENFYDGVHDGRRLGEGAGGIVRLVKHKRTGIQYAVKCLDKTKLDRIHNKKEREAALRRLREEIVIMCQLDHPGIHRLEEVYETEQRLYLIQQLCKGEDLFDAIERQPDFHFQEEEVADLMRQMLSALRYLHSKNIIHRDLKLENFLFDFPDATPNNNLKMIDFGYGRHFTHPGEMMGEKVGTLYTSAPEVLKGGYDERADIWSMGVIAYNLFCGETPFGGLSPDDDFATVRTNILSGRVTFEEDAWDMVSEEGKKFVKKLLNMDRHKRPTASEALEDPWIRSYSKEAGHNKKYVALNHKTCQCLKQYKCYSKLRRVLSEALGFSLLPEQVKSLRKEFDKIDSERQGEFAFISLKKSLDASSTESDGETTDEEDAEEMFNAMRIHKTDSKVRWHEFVAAELGQCSVTEKNLEIAFDKIDQNGKGYITPEDVKHLLGEESDEPIREMWEEEFASVDRVTYEMFCEFMKRGLAVELAYRAR